MTFILFSRKPKTLVLRAFLIKRKERKLQYQWYHNFRSYMVEARRVELLSENKSVQLSTSVAYVLGFPSRFARKQANRIGRFIIHAMRKS